MKNGAVLAWSSKYSRYGQFMQNLKSKIMQTLDIAAKEDAGIFEAMLLGEKDNLEDEVKIRYQMAGYPGSNSEFEITDVFVRDSFISVFNLFSAENLSEMEEICLIKIEE